MTERTSLGFRIKFPTVIKLPDQAYRMGKLLQNLYLMSVAERLIRQKHVHKHIRLDNTFYAISCNQVFQFNYLENTEKRIMKRI